MVDVTKTKNIQTHENVSIKYETANLGTRSIAYMWDKIFTFIIYVIIAVGIVLISLKSDNVISFNEGSIFGFGGSLVVSIFLIILLIFIIDILYYFIFEAFIGGRTPGKMIVGIRVISATGEPAGILACFLRTIMRFFHSIPCGPLIDIISIFVSKDSTRLGDKVANTIVVKERTNSKHSKKINEILADIVVEDKDVVEDEYQIPQWQKNMESIKLITESLTEDPAGNTDDIKEKQEDISEYSPHHIASEQIEGIPVILSKEEYQVLHEYLAERENIADREEFDKKWFVLIAKRSKTLLPPEITNKMILEYITHTENLQSKLYKAEENIQ